MRHQITYDEEKYELYKTCTPELLRQELRLIKREVKGDGLLLKKVYGQYVACALALIKMEVGDIKKGTKKEF
jgi:hypothetical protein